MSAGIKLSVELEKLRQIGISIAFSDEYAGDSILDYFEYDPDLLFMAGNESYLHATETEVFTSLSTFAKAGYSGTFVSDRPIMEALRNSRLAQSLKSKQALLVSDRFYSKAHIKQDLIEPEPTKHVFISGSRSQVEIPQIVQDSLNAIIDQKIGVYIGDSEKGVDKEILDYLRAPLYDHVTVFSVSAKPRVPVEPSWKQETVQADSSLKGRERQTVKDRAMADRATWGLAVFNPIELNRYGNLQVSAGTLRNTIQMLLNGKMVRFFYVYEGNVVCKVLKYIDDLEHVINSYQKEHLDTREAQTILAARNVKTGEEPTLAKARIIRQKYNQLLKSEKKLIDTSGGETSNHEPIQQTLMLDF